MTNAYCFNCFNIFVIGSSTFVYPVQLMKETRGKAKAELANEILREMLAE